MILYLEYHKDTRKYARNLETLVVFMYVTNKKNYFDSFCKYVLAFNILSENFSITRYLESTETHLVNSPILYILSASILFE